MPSNLIWRGPQFFTAVRSIARGAAREAAEFIGDKVNTKLTTGTRSGKIYGTHQASAPGEPPAELTGRLARGFRMEAYGNQWVFGARIGYNLGEVPYARILELGGETHDGRYIAPRPYFMSTIEENMGTLEDMFGVSFRKLNVG